MTRETRVVFALDEIRGLRWQCTACGTATSFDRALPVPLECPGCQAVFRTRLQPDGVFDELVAALRLLRELSRETKLPVSLHLEFGDDAP